MAQPGLAARTAPPGQGRPARAAARGAQAAGRHLRGPSLETWHPVFEPQTAPSSTDDFPKVAVVTAAEVSLYPRADDDDHAIGLARMGNRLPAERSSSDHHCHGGHWYRVSGGAYLCSGDGVYIADAPLRKTVLDAADRHRRPAIDQPMPYRYAKAIDGGPPRLLEMPDAAQIAALAKGDEPSDIVERHMRGAYLLALARKLTAHGVVFYETVAGRFVRAEDLDPRPTPPMHGEHLGKGNHLPLAFAFRDTELYCIEGAGGGDDGGAEDGGDDDGAEPCGTVDKHARFHPRGTVERDGRSLVTVAHGLAVPRDDLRMVEKVERPDGVDPDDKWIHINLTEQSLVAYRGDKPLLATLVSTGRPGHDTQTGLFRVERKYLTKTMRGKDEDGVYEVQEVPWTLYYDHNFAVHGAYWHDRFGRTKSHGCVNVPPADARWIYYWADPRLPRGWSARFDRLGTWVYVTGKTPPGDPDDELDEAEAKEADG